MSADVNSAAPSTGGCIVLTTTDTQDHANLIIDAVLKQRLAACVQTLPIQSAYMWIGEIRNEPELLLILNARRDDVDAVSAAIRAAHSYETPEIICLDIASADQAYLAWVMNRGG